MNGMQAYQIYTAHTSMQATHEHASGPLNKVDADALLLEAITHSRQLVIFVKSTPQPQRMCRVLRQPTLRSNTAWGAELNGVGVCWLCRRPKLRLRRFLDGCGWKRCRHRIEEHGYYQDDTGAGPPRPIKDI